MTEVEYLESKIRTEREECVRLREKEQNDKLANSLHSIFQSLIDNGFSEEQAWELFKEMCKTAWSNN